MTPASLRRISIGLYFLLLTVIAIGGLQTTLAADPAKARTDKIKFHDHDGKTVQSLKLKEDGAKLVDGNEKELARFTVSHDKLKVKDADDKPVAVIVLSADRLKLESDSEGIICQLRRQADGDWKMENAEKEHVATIKKHGDGVEVEDHLKQRAFKVKIKSGKTLLVDANEKTVYSTKEEVTPAAMGCLGVETVSDLRLRFALLYAMDHARPKS